MISGARARVSVWPGRRRVPAIVAPDSWGARGAECLPRDVLRHTLPTAVSLCNGPTACHGLCHRHGSGTTEARPPASNVPPAPHGGLGFYRATWSIPGRIFGAVHHYCFPWRTIRGQFGVLQPK